MVTTTAPNWAISPTSTTLQHTEGTRSTYTFSIIDLNNVLNPTETPPVITQVVASASVQPNIESITPSAGTITVVIGTGSLYPWTLSYTNVDTNATGTVDNVWTLPDHGAVYRYEKHMSIPVITLDVYADYEPAQSGIAPLHQQYTITVTPDFSAGRDQLVGLAHASPV